MMKNYIDDELKKMSNDELEKELSEHEWLHRDLLNEYDKRHHDGRIKWGEELIQPDQIEEFVRKRYAEKRERKKAS